MYSVECKINDDKPVWFKLLSTADAEGANEYLRICIENEDFIRNHPETLVPGMNRARREYRITYTPGG